MPRYFFHTADGGVQRDHEGTELAGVEEARAAAVRFAGEVLSSEPNALSESGEFQVRVSDQSGAQLMAIFIRAERL